MAFIYIVHGFYRAIDFFLVMLRSIECVALRIIFAPSFLPSFLIWIFSLRAGYDPRVPKSVCLCSAVSGSRSGRYAQGMYLCAYPHTHDVSYFLCSFLGWKLFVLVGDTFCSLLIFLRPRFGVCVCVLSHFGAYDKLVRAWCWCVKAVSYRILNSQCTCCS